jgi:hypothetical protein
VNNAINAFHAWEKNAICTNISLDEFEGIETKERQQRLAPEPQIIQDSDTVSPSYQVCE